MQVSLASVNVTDDIAMYEASGPRDPKLLQ
jgi:hypothetical protein